MKNTSSRLIIWPIWPSGCESCPVHSRLSQWSCCNIYLEPKFNTERFDDVYRKPRGELWHSMGRPSRRRSLLLVDDPLSGCKKTLKPRQVEWKVFDYSSWFLPQLEGSAGRITFTFDGRDQALLSAAFILSWLVWRVHEAWRGPLSRAELPASALSPGELWLQPLKHEFIASNDHWTGFPPQVLLFQKISFKSVCLLSTLRPCFLKDGGLFLSFNCFSLSLCLSPKLISAYTQIWNSFILVDIKRK